MNDDLKKILSDFTITLEKYLTEKSNEIDKKVELNRRLLAESDDATKKIKELDGREAALWKLQEEFDHEKELFTDKVKEFNRKEEALRQKMNKVQSLLSE
jgi:hypothetical protein